MSLVRVKTTHQCNEIQPAGPNLSGLPLQGESGDAESPKKGGRVMTTAADGGRKEGRFLWGVWGVLALIVVAFSVTSTSAQTTVFVDGTTNLYGAGHAAPPDPGGTGAGTLPVEILLPAGSDRVVTFSSASGTVDYGGCCAPNPPDGIPLTLITTPIWDGLAGPQIPQGRHVSGVFLTDMEPADPAPCSLLYSAVDFEEISPDIHQIFFVGDGLSGQGTGLTQWFFVPDGATRLFLGFLDCFPPCSVPGGYDDNSGGVSITVEVMSATPTGAGAVPDGGSRPGSSLTVEPAGGGDLSLSWGSSCALTDDDYAVYEGTMDDFTSHVPVTCGTEGGTTAIITPEGGNTYYIIAPFNSTAHEGSHGLRSDGSERSSGCPTCRTRVAGCPVP